MGQLCLDPYPNFVFIELRMAMPNAIRHETAGAVEEPRSLEELLGRAHRPGASYLFAVERVGELGERSHAHKF